MFPEEIALETYETDAATGEREHFLRQVKEDADKVFDWLFEQYYSMVFYLALRIVGDREEALDVSQEVFLTIHRKLHRFRAESSLKTWIYRITLNRASNRCRWWNRLRRRGTISLEEHLSGDGSRSLLDSLASGGFTPEESLMVREKLAEVERSLARLPLNQRIAVVMRDVEGMSYEEIAEVTKTSLGTVKSRISRGRGELKRRLNGALG